MARVPSPIKITKDGVTYISNVDRVKYTLTELSRAALVDVAKLIRKRMVQKLRKLPGMKRSRRIYRSTQYWVRRRETDLQIGFKHDSWYGVLQELGGKNQPKREVLRSTVMENLDEIQRIEGKYLSTIEDENRALGLIDDGEAKGDES